MTPIQLPTFAEDISAAWPLLSLGLFALVVLLCELLMSPANRRLIPWVAIWGTGLSLALAVILYLPRTPPPDFDIDIPAARSLYAFSGMLRIDPLAQLAHKVIMAAMIFFIAVSPRYIEDRVIARGEYYALLLAATFGMCALAASNDLFTLFLNFELVAITFYILAGCEHQNLKSTEASFKYFLTGSFAAAFLLFGLVLIYGAAGTSNIDDIVGRTAAGRVQPALLTAGLALVIVGFGFKLTLAPFHMYAPDLYAGAPTPVVGAIATASKVAALAAFMNLFRIIAARTDPSDGLTIGLYAVTAASILVGNIGAIVQPNIRRMLAYSGVAHSGYTMIPLVAVMSAPAADAAGLPADAESAVGYYLMAYALMSGLAFAVIASLGAKGEAHIDRYVGLASRAPVPAAALALALISLTGVPLTVGFIGKFYLFSVAVHGGLYGLAILGVTASVASAYYYLRVIVKMYMEEPKEVAGGRVPTETPNAILLVAGAAGVLLFAFYPAIFIL